MEFAGHVKKKRYLNLTPLIDVIFLLIVFFMLTSEFTVSNIINLDISKVEGSSDAKADGSLIFTLLADGKFLYSGQEYSLSRLQSKAKEMMAGNLNREIVIVSSQETSVQHIVTAMDHIKSAGGRNISISEIEE